MARTVLRLTTLFKSHEQLPLVVFVELTKLTIYSALAPEPLVLDFPESSVEDMEFTDTRFIDSQLNLWISEEKIKKTNTYIVLSEKTYFQQEFSALPVADDPKVAEFISMIPFEQIMHKVFQIEQVVRVVALSKNLYRPLLQVFEKQELPVTLVIPQFALNPELLQQAQPVELAAQLQSQFDHLKLLSFVSEEERRAKLERKKAITTGLPQDKKQLIILSAVFSVLLIALVFVYRWSQTSDLPPTIPVASPAALPSPVVVASPEVVASSSAEPAALSPESLADISIQVLNGSGVPGQADRVRRALEEQGFTSITTGNSEGGTVSRASIIFTPSVSQQVRQQVRDAVGSVISTEPIVQDDPELASFDVRIITSN